MDATTPIARTRPRDAGIDALRGFSILSVLIGHGVVSTALVLAVLPHSAVLAIGHAYYGVATFFAVSGFLITSLALQRYGDLGSIDLRNFYVMRAGRIVPCLGLFLLTMTALYLLGVPGFVPADPAMFWGWIRSAMTFQSNQFYYVGNAPGVYAFAPLWSLAVEEVFYLVFPIACVFLRRDWIVAAGLLCVVAIGPLYRTEAQFVYMWWSAADLLALGCLAALAVRYGRPVPNAAAQALRLAGLATLLAVFAAGHVNEHPRLGPSLAAFGAALFLYGNAFATPRMPKLLRPLGAVLGVLGKLSYELYVFHMAASLLASAAFGYAGGAAASAALLIALLAGCWMLSRRVNEPANEIIRRFYARPILEANAQRTGNHPELVAANQAQRAAA